MNTNILKKCIDKLRDIKTDEVSSSEVQYVLGMLETLYEMQTDKADLAGIVSSTPPAARVVLPTGKKTDAPVDEAAVLDAKARAALETIKDLGSPLPE
jgi:hypothetical protein